MQNLAPCPFCDGEAEFERLGTSRQSSIIACSNCGCRLEANETEENNGSQWNRRSLSSERLKTHLDRLVANDARAHKFIKIGIALIVLGGFQAGLLLWHLLFKR